MGGSRTSGNVIDTKVYLAYLLDQTAEEYKSDPSAKCFLKLVAKYVRQEAGITAISTNYMGRGYKSTEVTLIETTIHS